MKKALIIGSSFLLPMVAAAQVEGSEIEGYLNSLIKFINETIIPFMIAIAVLVFIWGIFQYFILGASDEGKREKGKDLMIWGIIGFVLMVSITGIIALFSGATGLNDTLQTDDYPKVPSI